MPFLNKKHCSRNKCTLLKYMTVHSTPLTEGEKEEERS